MNMQIIHLRCCGIVKNRTCKRNGKFMYMGKNYCKTHEKIQMNVSLNKAPAHAIDIKNVVFVDEDTECSICFCNILNGVQPTITNCGHVFHHNCLSRWKNSGTESCQKCPICRKRTNNFRECSSQIIPAIKIKNFTSC